MKPRIVLVDDDRNILASVSMALENEGFCVDIFNNGEMAIEKIMADPPDLAILDVKMPRLDGFEVLKKIREHSDLPVVFLTSKDEETDQFEGLRLGADDYIIKPFSQRLLIARIQAVLRRRGGMSENRREGDLEMDDGRYLCHWKGKLLDLTVTEYLIVRALTRRRGHVKSREQLMDEAYGETLYVDDRTIDSHIKRLRRKFKEADHDFDSITTVYGAGYKFCE